MISKKVFAFYQICMKGFHIYYYFKDGLVKYLSKPPKA
jgi:hypothetical protein